VGFAGLAFASYRVRMRDGGPSQNSGRKAIPIGPSRSNGEGRRDQFQQA
jgi:hypothetical protein